jgi:cation:H+ antiporter
MASLIQTVLQPDSWWHAGLLLLAGVVLLEYGANWLVGGSSSLARHFGVSELIVGSTIVSAGTTLPELMVSVFALVVSTVKGASDIAIGNVVGSNIVDIALILGLVALLASMPRLHINVLLPELLIMLGTMALMGVLCLNGKLDYPVDTVLLLLVFVGYLVFQVWDAKKNPEEAALEEEPHHPLHVPVLILGGVVALALGARCLVNGAIFVAHQVGISELVIGLTIVAVGTSLPELATNVASALKGESELGMGDIVGANVLNIAFNLGLTGTLYGLIRGAEITVASEFFARDYWWMLGFAVLLTVALWRWGRLTRPAGAVFLVGYLVYVVSLFVGS